MQIVSAAEMTAADRRSVEQGVPIATLMENAGAAVARFVLRRGPERGLIVALCGKGNNGGDGMVAALHLARAGRQVRVTLLGAVSALKPPVDAVMQQLRSQLLYPPEICEIRDDAGLQNALSGASLLLDAVVGTGFKPPLRGLAATARDLLAAARVPVVAVDLPSGWDADATVMHAPAQTGGQGSEAFRADAVVTFAAPKPAHIFGHLTPGKAFGPVVVAEIGTPPDALQAVDKTHWAGASKALAETPREVDGNKGKFGHALLIGGAFGKSGAPAMMSLAALRTGAGLVTAAVPRSILLEVARITPELMTTSLEETAGEGGLAVDVLEPKPLAELLKGIKVVGIGPGLGQGGSTPEFVRRFVERVTLPMVIDADALNCLADDTALLRRAASGRDHKGAPRTLVLTPHPGEMARLIGGSVKDVEADRIGIARSFATEHGIILVLKGWRTLVAHPDGQIAVNTTGNPSMAKGGSGDILTGIVAAMLGQYPEHPAEAVEAAVFLHGLAGDFACLAQDEHTVLATDTVGRLAQAFRGRVKDADGLTWIVGTATNGSFALPASELLRASL